MSISDVIKNIFTFANILSQAGTEVVRNWDELSLRNALNWARYCVKVEEEARERLYRDDLDRHIQCLTVHLNPVCLVDLNLERLGNALSLLCSRLLQNPDLPRNFVPIIHGVTEESELLQFSDTVQKRKYARNLFLVVSVADDIGPFPVKMLGQQIFQTLLDLWKLHTDNRRHGYFKFVSKWTGSILEDDGGMELLGHVLLAVVRTEQDHSPAECVKGRILKSLVSTSTPNSHILSCEGGLLCQLSDSDDRFLRIYINHLVSWTSSLAPSYSLAADGNLYKWQYPGMQGNDGTLSFQNLVKHVSQLLNYNKRLKAVLEPILCKRKGQSHFSVWKDLLKGVQDLDKGLRQI